MHTSKKIYKLIAVVLAVCGVLLGIPQTALAADASGLPEGSVVIGFIDSGIAPYNIDESHLLPGKNYVFPENDTVDRIGHGTKTAGMVLGSADGTVEGAYSAAYAVPLVVVDKYDSGVTKDGGVDALTAAIYDAVDVFDCDVINISLSTVSETEALKAAVEYAYKNGVIIVTSVSNYSNALNTYYPAYYDHVIAVGAADGESVASFSQVQDADFFYQGKRLPAVSERKGGKNGTESGTSFACACVSGICASILAQHPGLTLEQMKALLHLRTFDPASGFIRSPFLPAEIPAEGRK